MKTKVILLKKYYKILIEGKFALFKNKSEISLPFYNLTKKISKEIEDNSGRIPYYLSLSSLSYSSVLKRGNGFRKTVNELLEYFHCDLICYRAESPKELKKIQNFYWNPLILKMKKKLNIDLNVFTGISYTPQKVEEEKKIKDILVKMNEFELTALENFVRLSGSFSIGFLIFYKFLNIESAWKLSILDENWQMEKWGEDKENIDILNKKKDEFLLIYHFYCMILKSNQ